MRLTKVPNNMAFYSELAGNAAGIAFGNSGVTAISYTGNKGLGSNKNILY
jgi:hypothetical protein